MNTLWEDGEEISLWKDGEEISLWKDDEEISLWRDGEAGMVRGDGGMSTGRGDGMMKTQRETADKMRHSGERAGVHPFRNHSLPFRVTLLVLALLMLVSVPVNAQEGSMGYAGGISVNDRLLKDTYRYREVVFVTGKPVVLDGTLAIKKSVKAGKETATYTYKMANVAQDASLTRVLLFDTTVDTKNNGQLTRATLLSRTPTEVLRIGGNTYTLLSEQFTRSNLTDPQAALNYHAGEFRSKKTYRVGTGADAPTVTVESTGSVHAYDQYWSSTQTQKLKLLVTWARAGASSWSGTAQVNVSESSRQNFSYRENEPTQISFDGGYLRTTWNESVLSYTARFPEFGKDGMATDRMVDVSDRLSMDTEPVNERLMVPDIRHLKGHWSEKPVHILYGLQILPGTGSDFNPQKYLTRSEFIAQAVQLLKAVPTDPNVRTTFTRVSRTTAPEILPFIDLKEGDPFLADIVDASNRGIVIGRGMSYFRPKEYITRAEVATIAIRALGLGNLATWPYAVTPFTDSDAIAPFARNAAAVCAEIGIMTPDASGRFRPTERITAAETAELLYRLLNYMGDELVTDYREHITQW